MLSDGGVPGEAQFAKEARLLSCFQQSCVAMNVYTGRYKRLNWKILKQTATLRRFHGEDSICSKLKLNYSIYARIMRWICGRTVILSLDFSLLGSGVRKWSVQHWASLT